MNIKHLALLLPVMVSLSACGVKDGIHELQILTTNDVHGTWFPEGYIDSAPKKSLMAAKHYIDSVRTEYGKDNVLLIDAGDCLQGDNAAYYFNYVDTLAPHLFPRLVSYMDYDAIVVGNHDIETGHKVYDRIRKDLESKGIPFLAGNAIRTSDGKPYFAASKIFNRAGLKVALLGYTNPNMKAWLTESLWSGMTFESLIPLVQQDVDAIREKENPQVVIVAIHSGTGKGDGSIYESQGLDLLGSLKGVDCLVCSHDHSPYTEDRQDICLVNTGSHSRNVGHASIQVTINKGKVTDKKHKVELIPISPDKTDKEMFKAFENDFNTVKQFTLKEIGPLDVPLKTTDAFTGMSPYINLIHTVCLGCKPAKLSFAAPLTYNGFIDAGTLVYNDLFTIYPFENQLFIINLTGKQVKDYLEYSYDGWINTLPADHLLKINKADDLRYSQSGWSFTGRSYNFDSCGGLVYKVDVTKPFGERIIISSLADGSAFDLDATYPVAITSYRASGGGDLIKLAGVDTDHLDDIVVERYGEIRNLIYDYILEKGAIKSADINNSAVIGSWKFVPENLAEKQLEQDMNLLFGQ